MKWPLLGTLIFDEFEEELGEFTHPPATLSKNVWSRGR